MNKMTPWMVMFVLLLVTGLGFGLAGCEKESPTGPVVTPSPLIQGTPIPTPTPTAAPTPTPVPTPVTLLDTTVSLNANAWCRNGWDFCADNLTFMPTQVGKSVTVKVTAPSNLDPDVAIFNSAGAFVAGGSSYTPGLEVVTFTPYQLDVLRVMVDDYQRVGGAVRVVVTQ